MIDWVSRKRAGELLNDRSAKYTPEKKRKIWDFWHGNRLAEAVRALEKDLSYLEALWLAEGRISLRESIFHIAEDDFVTLWELAHEKPEAFDLMTKICASRLESNAKLTEAQGLVAGSVLRGSLKRPKRPGRPRSRNWDRDVLIYHGIEAALQTGFKRERSEGSPSDCAFSLVERAFNDAGNHIVTYNTVRNVWRGAEKSGLKSEIEKLHLASATLQLGDQSKPAF